MLTEIPDRLKCIYRSSGNCKTRKTQRRLIDSNIGDANRSDVRRGSAEPDNPTFRSFGLHCPSPKHRGFKPPPLGGLFLGWGLNPQPKNFALKLSTVNCQLSTVNCQLLRERGGFTCFTFGLDIVLRHSALRAYETFKTWIELIGRFPQSTSLAKINRWMLKLAVFRRSNLPIESLPKAQEMPRLGEKAQV
ncbi:MAG: hypothetical protein LH628_11035 [Microcoleus sp. CAN_BIN18]|nr:hypothetical protein [Microcoleus sp. CAN_BIN18]